MNKELICSAFCDQVAVRSVPAGFAVQTPFTSADGDPIGFYVVRSEVNPALFRLEDSGTIVPMLDAAGVNLKSGNRAEAFERILEEYGAQFEDETYEVHTAFMEEKDIASSALNFVALLLRLQDLELLTPELVENTFKEDASKAITQRFHNQAQLARDTSVSSELSNYVVDMLISKGQDDPVAVYFATSEPRVDEALILWMESHLKNIPCKVILLLEHAKPKQVSERALARAQNFLEAVPVFRGFEPDAMEKIAKVTGLDRMN